MLPFAATSAPDTPDFTFMGMHGTLGILVAIGMGAVTLVAIFKTGLIPLARAVARIVEAVEIINGTEKTDGLQKRLDQADADRTRQTEAIEDIGAIVKKAGLLNGKGEMLVQNVGQLMSNQNEWRTFASRHDEFVAKLEQHISEESTRNAAIWAAILEERKSPSK